MFTGSLVALVTPMALDLSIDYAALERLVDWHLAQKTDGLVILGTTGESPTIHDDERKKIVSRVVQQVKGKIPVIVGTGTNATDHTIALTAQAMQLGADAALIVTPYYNKPTQEGLYLHFKAVSEAVPLPQILYNVPSRTGCDLLPATVLRLSALSNIVGIKEATGDLTRVKSLAETSNSLDLLSGDDKTAMDFMLAGGKGVISVVANVAPLLFHNLCVASIAGDRNQAMDYQQQLMGLHDSLFIEANPIPVKWALAEMGMITPAIRLPLTPLSKLHHELVRLALRQAGVQLLH